MSFKAYEKYKDSGVEWLGEVPAQWDSKRLKFLFDICKRPIRDQDEIITCFRDGTVTLRSKKRADGFTNAVKEIGYQGVRNGDLVIHAMDAFAGAIGVSDSDGKSTPVYSVCRPRDKEYTSYYYSRLLRHMALSGFVTSLAKGIRERSTDFRWADASEIFLPVPSMGEQENITAFLDHETARIDALIEEQQRLIALLKEKRQAVISHAVTKGLDPNVPMKDSGVEWLGEVPAHWEVVALSRVIKDIEQGWSPECESTPAEDDNWGVLKAGAVNNGIYRETENKKLPEHLSPRPHLEVKAGDIIMCRASGSPELIGSAAYIRHTRAKLMLSDKTFRIITEISIDNIFLAEQLKSRPLRLQIELSINGAEGLANNLSKQSIKNLRIVLPNLFEQKAISEYIKIETQKISNLLDEAKSLTSVLLERRSALISAAVTGKIDVRDWQPPEASQTAAEPAEASA